MIYVIHCSSLPSPSETRRRMPSCQSSPAPHPGPASKADTLDSRSPDMVSLAAKAPGGPVPAVDLLGAPVRHAFCLSFFFHIAVAAGAVIGLLFSAVVGIFPARRWKRSIPSRRQFQTMTSGVEAVCGISYYWGPRIVGVERWMGWMGTASACSLAGSGPAPQTWD